MRKSLSTNRILGGQKAWKTRLSRGGGISSEHRQKIANSNRGQKRSDESKLKMSIAKKGMRVSPKTEFKKGQKSWNAGLKLSDEQKSRLNLSGLEKGRGVRGEDNYRWIKDRSKLVFGRGRITCKYYKWVREVTIRDGKMCRMMNKDCKGRLEIHHILNWKDYPELRYDINNGITLCHFHHPIGRVKESNMSPYFQEIIKTQND